MNKMVSTSINNFNQETLFDKHNQYLIYKGGFNSDNSTSSYNKSKSIISTLYENQKNKDDKIFGDPFKNIDINNNKKKEEPPVKFFQTKPRIFDDKLLLNYQFVKKNQFLKLKEIMS